MDATYGWALVQGLVNVLQWPAIGFLGIGIAVGIVLGALPAIGGVTGLILLLPFTYSIDGTSAFALLLGMYAVVATGDTISSILIGVPGGVGSQATVIDGYALAKRGQAARALGAAYASSAVGGVLGAIVLALSIPIAKPIVLAFGMPEYFALAVLGLVMVGALAGRSIARGFAVACAGLIIASIGAADFSGVPRFWFGQAYLLQSPPLVSIVLGLFGLAELLEMAAQNSSISRTGAPPSDEFGMMRGIRDVVHNWWLTVRCSIIGVYVGILPGLGASIVDWAAYGHAVQAAKDKSEFGKGDIRGVIAPETANNALRGGALIPTLAFGIPGDFGMAILLGALTIQGIKPGVDMLTTQLPLTFTMVWTLLIANVIGAAVLMLWSRQISRIVFVDGNLIVPLVLLFVVMGSWLGSTTMGDLIVMLIAGFVGYWMKSAGWPRPPIVIALVLGPIIENSLIVSMRTYEGWSWVGRPTVLVIFAVAILTIVATAWSRTRARREERTEGGAAMFAGDMVTEHPTFSLPLSLTLLVVFVAATVTSAQMSQWTGIFPLIAGATGLAVTAVALWTDVRLVDGFRRAGTLLKISREAARDVELARGLLFLGYIALLVLGVFVVGQKVAIPLALGAYLVLWGKYQWWAGALMVALSYATIELIYSRLLNVNLQAPAIF